MKCRLLFTMPAGPTAPDDICIVENGRRFVSAGTEIEHRDAWRLVHGGHAEAVDEECREKVDSLNVGDRGILRQVHKRIMDEFHDFQEDLEAEEEYDDDE